MAGCCRAKTVGASNYRLVSMGDMLGGLEGFGGFTGSGGGNVEFWQKSKFWDTLLPAWGECQSTCIYLKEGGGEGAILFAKFHPQRSSTASDLALMK